LTLFTIQVEFKLEVFIFSKINVGQPNNTESEGSAMSTTNRELEMKFLAKGLRVTPEEEGLTPDPELFLISSRPICRVVGGLANQSRCTVSS
jgi:hypothetical protein